MPVTHRIIYNAPICMVSFLGDIHFDSPWMDFRARLYSFWGESEFVLQIHLLIQVTKWFVMMNIFFTAFNVIKYKRGSAHPLILQQ